eukprot:scaffold29178_cov63-Cyclotella_meneghiniana.AAC.7
MAELAPRKEELQKALEDQIELGEEGLAKEDEYLLDIINLDNLDNSSGVGRGLATKLSGC